MSNSVTLQEMGGQSTVGGIATQYPFAAGVDVTQTMETSDGFQAVELVKTGTFSIVSTATGVATNAITFSNAFPAACDGVLLTFTSLGGAVINGGPYAASVTAAGFTASTSITTAGTTNITGTWVAFGH